MPLIAPDAAAVAALLKARGESIAVAESSTGGLVSAALLAVPGASAYFLGGSVIYTRQARRVLLDVSDAAMVGTQSATERYARLLARTARRRFAATWGIGETGATGPTGNSYGNAAGHSCIAVTGPVELIITLETGRNDRAENMGAFAQRALALLEEALGKAPAATPE